MAASTWSGDVCMSASANRTIPFRPSILLVYSAEAASGEVTEGIRIRRALPVRVVCALVGLQDQGVDLGPVHGAFDVVTGQAETGLVDVDWGRAQ
ncbi:hypothetical protein Rhe02_86400 [Rhizocola hellebori]|uniref:Uncharacterized protein n=2 Tax=Rhizocola hellebori TaxID=1392758 RepID=A0A8J3VLW4_9ACTN|nr:hypothetical protein Rhe02_86400 [Rhizocola hellebori]